MNLEFKIVKLNWWSTLLVIQERNYTLVKECIKEKISVLINK